MVFKQRCQTSQAESQSAKVKTRVSKEHVMKRMHSFQYEVIEGTQDQNNHKLINTKDYRQLSHQSLMKPIENFIKHQCKRTSFELTDKKISAFNVADFKSPPPRQPLNLASFNVHILMQALVLL